MTNFAKNVCNVCKPLQKEICKGCLFDISIKIEIESMTFAKRSATFATFATYIYKYVANCKGHLWCFNKLRENFLFNYF